MTPSPTNATFAIVSSIIRTGHGPPGGRPSTGAQVDRYRKGPKGLM
jgi:hypothetical protein